MLYSRVVRTRNVCIRTTNTRRAFCMNITNSTYHTAHVHVQPEFNHESNVRYSSSLNCMQEDLARILEHTYDR